MVMNVSIDKFWRFPGTFLLLFLQLAEKNLPWRIFYGSITLLSSLSKRSRVHVYSHDSYKLLYYERRFSFAQFSSESSWVNKNCIYFEKKSNLEKYRVSQ